MASPAAVRTVLVGAGVSALSLALLQALLAQRLERAQRLCASPSGLRMPMTLLPTLIKR